MKKDKSVVIDQSLSAIQTARRLQKIATNIDNFFRSQIDRIEKHLEVCHSEQDRVQEVRDQCLALQQQKEDWSRERTLEVDRLNRACNQLIEGWRELEEARRKWLIEKSQETSLSSEFQLENMPFLESESNQTQRRSNEADYDTNMIDLLREAIQVHRERPT